MFWGEIGVVTLGVLIALLAQQVAEEVSWRNRVGDARVALRSETGQHYTNALEVLAAAPCVARQLDDLERRLLAGGARLTPAPMFQEGRVRYGRARPTATMAWRCGEDR